MEEELSDWVQDYLETDEDYLLQTDEEKFKTFFNRFFLTGFNYQLF